METAKPNPGATEKQLDLTYAYGNYEEGDGIYILALKNNDLVADVTVNLVKCGVRTGPDQIVIPSYKYPSELVDTFKKDLVKRVIKIVHYGGYDAYGELVELNDDWRKRCFPLENLLSKKPKKHGTIR